MPEGNRTVLTRKVWYVQRGQHLVMYLLQHRRPCARAHQPQRPWSVLPLEALGVSPDFRLMQFDDPFPAETEAALPGAADMAQLEQLFADAPDGLRSDLVRFPIRMVDVYPGRWGTARSKPPATTESQERAGGHTGSLCLKRDTSRLVA